MNMKLKSFPKFAKHEEKINGKINRLRKKIMENEQAIEALNREYVNLFAEDLDTAAVSNKLVELKIVNDTLKGEIDLIDNHDFREKTLARDVYDEYREVEKQLNQYNQLLWEKAQQLKKDYEESVKKLDKEIESLASRFNTEVLRNQLSPVIDSLDMSDSVKDNLRHEVDRGTLLGASPFKHLLGIKG